jgi:photosystem II stability/assembly factor-like uncharacterized protein
MNCFNKTIFFLIALFASATTTNAQWRCKGLNYRLYGCTASFPSAKVGYILSSPNLLHSTDSATNWQWLTLPSGHNLFDVFFVNDAVGWVAGGNHPNGIIFKTRDGGITWTKNKTVLKQILKVHFIDEQEGWAVGNENLYSVIYHTTDGGNEWTIQYEGTDYLRTIYFNSTNIGWAAGDNGQLFCTKNGGKQWIQSPRADIIHYRTIVGVSADTAWAAGGYQYGALYLSNNGGVKWQVIDDNNLAHINCISILNKNEIWLAGDRGTIIYSPNGGRTWLTQTIKTNEDIKFIKFFNSGYGIAIGDKGTILLYP